MHYLALNQFEATAGRRAGRESTATFDRRAASGGLRLLEA